METTAPTRMRTSPRAVVARQMGADYPFGDPEARKWVNFYGRTMYGRRFRKA